MEVSIDYQGSITICCAAEDKFILNAQPHARLVRDSYNCGSGFENRAPNHAVPYGSGGHVSRPVYYIRLILEGFVLPTVRCIAVNRSDVLLGRNVPEHFIQRLSH